MRAEEQAYAALAAAGGVVALVADRIYPDQAAQGADLPLIVFERTDTEPVSTIHDGPPIASKVTISASAWARTQLEADQVADQMQIAMHLVGHPVNRFSHVDETTGSRASAIQFEVWQT